MNTAARSKSVLPFSGILLLAACSANNVQQAIPCPVSIAQPAEPHPVNIALQPCPKKGGRNWRSRGGSATTSPVADMMTAQLKKVEAADPPPIRHAIYRMLR